MEIYSLRRRDGRAGVTVEGLGSQLIVGLLPNANLKDSYGTAEAVPFQSESESTPIQIDQTGLLERVNPRHAGSDDQGVDVVGAFVGFYGFQVHQVAHDGVIVGYSVGSQDVS